MTQLGGNNWIMVVVVTEISILQGRLKICLQNTGISSR
jgi:hypothetical protein